MFDVPLPSAGPVSGDTAGTDLTRTDLTRTAVVQFAEPAPTKAGDHQLLVALVSGLTGVGPASITLEQVCPACGESGHGPLRVVFTDAPDAAPTVHVSLTRAGGRLALAVTAAGPVGIDLESVAEISRAPVAGVLLSGAEAQALAGLDPTDVDAALAATWTAKEAVLKAAGTGLRVDPRDLTITLAATGAPFGGRSAAPSPVLTAWPDSPFALGVVHLLPLAAALGCVGTVAVVSAACPALIVVPLG